MIQKECNNTKFKLNFYNGVKCINIEMNLGVLIRKNIFYTRDIIKIFNKNMFTVQVS